MFGVFCFGGFWGVWCGLVGFLGFSWAWWGLAGMMGFSWVFWGSVGFGGVFWGLVVTRAGCGVPVIDTMYTDKHAGGCIVTELFGYMIK